MRDSSQPSFEDVFSNNLFPAEHAASPGLSASDLAEAFAADGGSRIGGRLGSSIIRPRFEGDTSELPPEACWTLQELVAAPHVREESRKHWSALLQHEEVLRSRLCELGLILEINREHGYAFTRQATDPSPHAHTLLRARTLSLAASTLTLYLYNQYLISPDDPVVETEDMIEHMLGYKPASDTDEAGFRRKILTAIKSLDDASIIKPVTGTTRYIIYGVITSILSAERVDTLNSRYKAIAAGTAAESGSPEDAVNAVPRTDRDLGAAAGPVTETEDGHHDG